MRSTLGLFCLKPVLCFAAFFVVIINSVAQTGRTDAPDLRLRLRLLKVLETPLHRFSHIYFDKNGRNVIVRGVGETLFLNPSSLEPERSIKACGGSDFSSSLWEGFNRFMTAGCVKSGVVEIWNIRSVRMIRKFELAVQRKFSRLDFVVSIVSPDESRIVLYDMHSEPTELWHIESGVRIATLTPFLTDKGARDADSALFSPDSRVVAVSYNGSVYLWDAQTGEMLFLLVDPAINRSLSSGGFTSHQHIIYDLLFSHDGKYLFTGSIDTKVKQWDVSTGKLVRTFSGHKHRIKTLALSPDGRILAIGSQDEKVKLWDTQSGRLIWTSPPHKSYVWRIFFSPDGERFITMTGSDGNIGSEIEIRMWETATGKLLGKMPGKWQQSSFSPDWRYFVMVGKKKNTIELYEFIDKLRL